MSGWVDVMKDGEQVLSPVDIDALPTGFYRPAPDEWIAHNTDTLW